MQRPLTSIIALPGKHVHSVADLAGKRVGTAGIPYQAAELRTALEHAGQPGSAHEVNVGFDLVPAMLSGQVDATLGGFWNYEAIQLRLMHKHPLVIPVDQAGVPTYDELVLVARENEARSDGVELRAFMQALTRGAHDVRSNPAGAVSALLAANPSLERKLQLESIQPDAAGHGPGRSRQALRMAEPVGVGDVRQLDVLPRPSAQRSRHASGLPPFTNEFLPGQGI